MPPKASLPVVSFKWKYCYICNNSILNMHLNTNVLISASPAILIINWVFYFSSWEIFISVSFLFFIKSNITPQMQSYCQLIKMHHKRILPQTSLYREKNWENIRYTSIEWFAKKIKKILWKKQVQKRERIDYSFITN
jgi:hypothetical protein